MKGWNTLPLPLIILSVVLFSWAVMSIAVLVMMPERRIAFYGFMLTETAVATVVLLLDFISPLLFMYAMWKKLKWGVNYGVFYNGIFISNSVVALFTFREVSGNAIYFPLITGETFIYIIYWEQNYFSQLFYFFDFIKYGVIQLDKTPLSGRVRSDWPVVFHLGHYSGTLYEPRG